MSPPTIFRIVSFASISAVLLPVYCDAQTLHWNEAVSGGQRDGTWDTTTTNWNSSDTGLPPTNETWPTFPLNLAATAAFNKAEGGTVNIDSSVTARRILAGDGGHYTLTGGTITNPIGILPIEVGTLGSGNFSIGSAIDSANLLKFGQGSLELSGTLSGNLRIQDGMVVLSGDNLPDDSTIDILPGAGVRLDGDDSIGDLVTNGSLSGAGSLTADTYSLLDGAVIDGHLGEGLFFKSDAGTVTVNGTLGSNLITVPAGTLVLSGGNLDDLAQVSTSTDGVLELNGDDTTGSYLQTGNGSLTGTGTLHATFGATLNGGEIVGNLSGDTRSTGDVLVSGSIGGDYLTVTGGTLTLTGSSTFNNHVRIAAGATLLDQGDLDSPAAIINNGTLTVDSTDTVSSYTQKVGAIFDGTGSLTTSYRAVLQGGEVAGTLLGDIISDGDILISGTIGGGKLDIREGTLTLTGTVNNSPVDIGGRAILLNQGNIGDASEVSNRGILTMDVDDTVATYYQDIGARLDGAGVLTATGGAILRGGEVVGTLLGNTEIDTYRTREPVLVSGSIGGGDLTISRGTLVLTGNSTNQVVKIETHGEMIDRGSLFNTAAVSNQGTFTVDVAETVDTYIQNGGGSLLNSSGILTVTNGATLHGGIIAGSLFGQITSNGAVAISGTVGGGDLLVTGGVLNLTGTALSRLVNVQAGELALSGDNIADTSQLSIQSGGLVTLTGNDTMDRVTISGTLNGPGTLSAGYYNLNNGAIINGHLGEGGLHMYPGRGGTVTVNGTLGMDSIIKREGTLILSGDNLKDTAALSGSFGVVRLNGDETVGTFSTYFSRLEGSGLLTATNGARLGTNSTVAGNLRGDITVEAFRSGTVLVSGTIGGGSLAVEKGTMILIGTSTNTPVTISPGALLDDQSGGLADTAVVTTEGDYGGRRNRMGTLNLDADDTITSYTSNGGLLSGTGILTASGGATLNDRSSITGNLRGNTVSDGWVRVSGSLGGGHLAVVGGILDFSGVSSNATVAILPGATLIDSGNLADTTALTNAGVLSINGHEQIGTYHNLAGASLQLDVTTPQLLDRLIAGSLILNPGSKLILESTNLGIGQVADIIDGRIDGTFSTIEALAGRGADFRYSFNPNVGTIQAIPGQPLPRTPRSSIFNLTWNQTQVIGPAFDDVHIDPVPAPGWEQTGNFHKIYYRDTGNPDPALRWQQIKASELRFGDTWVYDLDPGLGRKISQAGTQAALLGNAITQFQASYEVKLDRAGVPVLDDSGAPLIVAGRAGRSIANSLSPEVYQGMADFTRQAMRDHLRSARNSAPLRVAGKHEVFAAVHSSRGGVDDSLNNANYDTRPNGIVAGVRYQANACLRFGGLFGVSDGDIKGNLIDTDGSGFVLGAFGEYFFGPQFRSSVYSSFTYGDYDYDAARRSFGGLVGADGVDSNAYELVLGIKTIALQSERFRLIPSGALRYMNGSVDGFIESGPGVRMAVDELDIKSLLLDLALAAEFDLTEKATLSANLGYLHDFRNTGNMITGRYLGGGNPVRVLGQGIDDQAFVIGLGAWYDINSSFRLGINWRSAFYSSSKTTNSLGFGGSFEF